MYGFVRFSERKPWFRRFGILGEMREGITLWIDYVRMCFRNWLYHVDGIFLKEMEKYVEIFVEIDFLQVFSYTNFYAPFKVYGHVYSYY